LRGSPQGDVELMTQKEVLDFKPATRLEHIGHERRKQVDDRKGDDDLILPHSANPTGSNFRERQLRSSRMKAPVAILTLSSASTRLGIPG
jgi:hypothetical protein